MVRSFIHLQVNEQLYPSQNSDGPVSMLGKLGARQENTLGRRASPFQPVGGERESVFWGGQSSTT